MRALSASRLPNQLYITVCWMSAAARRVSAHVDRAGGVRGLSTSSTIIRETGAIAAFTWSGWSTASCTENSMIGRRLCVPALARLLRRITPLVQPDRERAEALERLGRRLDDVAEIVGRLANRLLEQGEQQLVLAVEVLVEAAERLLRLVDDLLDRELGRALLVDQLERGVEEALDPLLGAGTGRVQAAGDRTLAPGRRVRVLRRRCRRLSSQGNPLSLLESLPAPLRENGLSVPAQTPAFTSPL